MTSAVKDQQIALVTFARHATAQDLSIRFPICAAKTSFAPAQPIARIATEPVRYSDMPRNISFALTTPQFLDGSKDVTRRMGWLHLKVGDVLCAVKKGMGLKPGEKIERFGMIRVVHVTRERLDSITAHDVAREGFPNMTPSEFVMFFCASHKGCAPDSEVTRIEFERIANA